MSRLAELRAMRDFIDREIEDELRTTLPIGRDNVTVRDVADLYDLSPGDVLGGSRRHRAAHARQAVCWLLHRQGLSHREIADVVGYTDHTTVRHALRQVDGSPSTKGLLLGLEHVGASP